MRPQLLDVSCCPHPLGLTACHTPHCCLPCCCQQLEGVHAERKAVYDATVGQLELRVSSLEAEVRRGGQAWGGALPWQPGMAGGSGWLAAVSSPAAKPRPECPQVSGMEREVVQGEEQAAALTQRLATLDGHIKRLGSAASADALREK